MLSGNWAISLLGFVKIILDAFNSRSHQFGNSVAGEHYLPFQPVHLNLIQLRDSYIKKIPSIRAILLQHLRGVHLEKYFRLGYLKR